MLSDLTRAEWPSKRYGYKLNLALGKAMLHTHFKILCRKEPTRSGPLKINWKRIRGTEVYMERISELLLNNIRPQHVWIRGK